MTSALLQSIETKEQLEQILVAVNEALPENEKIKTQLSKYSQSKETFIKQLQSLWYERELPIYTELQIRQMNAAYYSQKERNQIASGLHGKDMVNMDGRNWVIKTSTCWRGWNANESAYYDSPLLFEGEIGYEKNFQPLIVSDPESKSVNLIISMTKIIKRGAEMCLSDSNWATLFLTFAKNHMANDHQTLSKYSDDLDNLFEGIVKSVNADSEIAKIRTSLSNISRKPGMSIQTPLYRLKSLYEMLISINLPNISTNDAKIRADYFACNVAKHLVTNNTAKIIADYIIIRQQRAETMNLMKLCNIITTHEAGTPADRIQVIMNVPASAARMDQSISEANNVEELLVAASAFPVDGSRTPPPRRDSRPTSPRFTGGHQSRPPNRQQNTQGWWRGRNGSAHSPNNRRYHQSPQRRGSNSNSYPQPTGGRGNSNNGRNSSQQRATTPQRRGNTPTGNQHGPNNTRNQRGSGSRNGPRRSSTPTGKDRCMRCNSSNHSSEQCETYPFHRGPNCEICGLVHKTKNHRQRTVSGRRDQPRRTVTTHQVVLDTQPSTSQPTPEVRGPSTRFHSDQFENIFGGKN